LQYWGATHHKKLVLQSIKRGMTPIEKNIIVVDETGKEYEATYLKRAKGLVKNGRARFIDENKICLLCPPELELEDKIMSENINTEQVISSLSAEISVNDSKPLTAREVFEKIAELQKQLTESSYHSLHRLDDSITSICENEESEEKGEQIGEVCNVFALREDTFRKMLGIYEKMYSDLNVIEAQKVAIVKSAFSEQIESICKSDLDNEVKFAAITDVTEKIADLTQKLLIPASVPNGRQKVAEEMTRIIMSKNSDDKSRENAVAILSTYMCE